jgi:hypothetical protein
MKDESKGVVTACDPRESGDFGSLAPPVAGSMIGAKRRDPPSWGKDLSRVGNSGSDSFGIPQPAWFL